MYTYQVSQSVSGLQYTHIVHAGCKMKLTIKSMHTLCPEVTPIPQFFRQSLSATRKRKQGENSTSRTRKSPRLNKQSEETANVETQVNRRLDFPVVNPEGANHIDEND